MVLRRLGSLSNYVVKRLCAWTATGGHRDKNRYDYAFLRVTRETPEYPERKRGNLGHLGFDAYAILHMTREAPNFLITDKVIAIGYPQSYGHSEFMYQVEGKVKKIMELGHFIAEMSNNPFDRGSVGGPWITYTEKVPTFDRDYDVIGVISHRGESPNTATGPLFDYRFIRLYQKIME